MAPRNEKRRNEILETAFRLFSSSPYNKVSFSAVAKEVGIKKSLLQHYFGHKDELVGTILNEILETSYSYMDTLNFEKREDDMFQKISDFNMLFFKAAQSNDRLYQFILESVGQNELLDAWIDAVCGWLRDLFARRNFDYLKIRTAISFSMGGSMRIYLHQEELGIDYRFICRNHVKSILEFFGYSQEKIQKVMSTTDERMERFSTEEYLRYCQEKIPWLDLK